MNFSRTIPALAFLILGSGCGGGGGGGGTTPNPTPTNSAPTANAGADQTVEELATVTLSGSGTDSDGTISSYAWSQTAGISVTLSDVAVSSPTFTTPDIDADETLTFQLTVTDNDGASRSDSVNILVTAIIVNVPPTVSAGDDQTSAELTTVTLTGTATDSDGTIASILWEQMSGTTATITSANQLQTMVELPDVAADEVLTFQLTITDDAGDSVSDLVAINVTNVIVNATPTANAGADQNVDENTGVTLTGSGSDVDGTIAGYQWVQDSGTTVTITNATSANAQFVAPSVSATEILSFTLTVTDNEGAIATDSVEVTVNNVVVPNVLPTANAGDDQTVDEKIAVTLNGSGTDEDGSIESYAWVQQSGSTVELTDATTTSPSFSAPNIEEGADDLTLVFQLTVTDNDGATATDTMTVTVTALDNVVPVVDAGEDQSVEEQSKIILTGTATDNDGEIVSYSWVQTAGISATLRNPKSETLTIFAPHIDTTEVLTFELTVEDNEGGMGTDTIDITLSPLVADFTLIADDKLTRFAIGDSSDFDINIYIEGDETTEAISEDGVFTRSYIESTNPQTLPDGSSTITKRLTYAMPTLNVVSTRYETYQIPDDKANPRDEIGIFEYNAGKVYALAYTDSGVSGAMITPGEPAIGYDRTLEYVKHRYDSNSTDGMDDSKDVDVVHHFKIDETEIVKTDLGNFETYKMVVNYSETGEDAKVDSQVSTFWLYPGLGIIKAEFTQTLGTNTPTTVTDIRYTLQTTTLPY